MHLIVLFTCSVSLIALVSLTTRQQPVSHADFIIALLLQNIPACMASSFVRPGPVTRAAALANQSANNLLNRPVLSHQQLARFSSDNVTVIHDESKKEFYVKLGKDKAYLSYDKLPDGTIDLYHTEVPHELRGKGLAGIITEKALDHMVKTNQSFKPTCTYTQKFLKDNANDRYLALIKK